MARVCSATLIGVPACSVLWLFLAYSVLGVVVESVYFAARQHVLEPRTGLLYLPFRPIYGAVGAVDTVLLHPLLDRPVLVFLLGALLASAAEYASSLTTEHLFGARSWDYSHHRLHLRGRVCLGYTLCWGALALVILYGVNPPLLRVVAGLRNPAGEAALGSLLILVVLSSALTVAALRSTRRRVSAAARHSGGTLAAVSTRWDRALQRVAPDSVLITSFPRMTSVEALVRAGDLTAVRRRPPTGAEGARSWRPSRRPPGSSSR